MPTRPAIARDPRQAGCSRRLGLFHRDFLPDFRTTPPPDLRSLAVAGEHSTPTTWFLSVADDAD